MVSFSKLLKLAKIFNKISESYLDDLPLMTAKEERQLAKNWEQSAAEFLEGQKYFKKERDKLLKKYDPDNVLLEDDGH